jgi:hypothetical protein
MGAKDFNFASRRRFFTSEDDGQPARRLRLNESTESNKANYVVISIDSIHPIQSSIHVSSNLKNEIINLRPTSFMSETQKIHHAVLLLVPHFDFEMLIDFLLLHRVIIF